MLHYLSYLKKETENIMDFVILYDNSSQDLTPEEYPDFQFRVFNSDKLDGFFHYGERRLPNPLVALVDFSKKSVYKPEFGISDSRFSCYARFPTGAYYICPPNNMDGKMQNCKVQMKFTL